MCDCWLWQHEYRKRWITYSDEEQTVLNNAAQKKETKVLLPSKSPRKQMFVDFQKMVQVNEVTLYEQRIRCVISSSGFFVWCWKDDNDNWDSFKPLLTVLLEVAYTKGEEEFKFNDESDFEVNLKTFEQLNKKTLEVCSVKREQVKVSSTFKIKNLKDLSQAEIVALQNTKKTSTKRKHKDASPNCTPAINKDALSEPLSNGHSAPSGPRGIVDSECPEKESFHVYQEGDTSFTATLNQTNLQNNNNKFYIIQLLEHKQKQQYAVWRRWGRVGNRGQTDFTKYGSSFSDALDSFNAKFYDKTRNHWSEAKNFSHVRGKYDLLIMDPSLDPQVKKAKLEVDSKLADKVKSLMEIICDQRKMEEIMNKMSFDCKKTPLGKLTLRQVKDGYVALNKISQILTHAESGVRLIEACNDFYTKVPHNFGMKTPPLIRTQKDIDEKLDMLETLSNIAAGMDVLNSNPSGIEHPLDKYYHSLKCSIEELSPESPEHEELNKCLQGTHGSTHSTYQMEIIDAFKCCKAEEEAAFKNSENTFLLWHGSKISNWLGILKKGLRIAPPEAPVTGYMFGKGIYFADASSKSANYCHATRQQNEGVLLLCEVSVGSMHTLTSADQSLPLTLPSGHDSVLGKGRMNPQEFKTGVLSSQAKIAHGPLLPDPNYNGALIYNEYIVYDVKRVKIQYLLRIRFNFK